MIASRTIGGRWGNIKFSEAVESVSVLKIVLGVGVTLIVVGIVLIPLPGPGLVVLTSGLIVGVIAGVLLRRGHERT